jgi:hypothetical protein
MIEGGASAPSPRPHLSRPYAVDHSSPTPFTTLNKVASCATMNVREKLKIQPINNNQGACRVRNI